MKRIRTELHAVSHSVPTGCYNSKTFDYILVLSRSNCIHHTLGLRPVLEITAFTEDVVIF